MSEERLMEIEALGAIYMDAFKELIPNPGGEDNFVGIDLDIKFTPDYPNEAPIIDLIATIGLTKDSIKDLKSDIENLAKENIGTSMIFILAGTIKEWLDNNNIDPNQVIEEEEEEEEEAPQEEEKVFDGTPVTVESFMEWRKKFFAETQPFAKKEQPKHTGKLTGRQLFETDSTLILSDSKFAEEGEEVSSISASTVKPKLEQVAAQVDWALFDDDNMEDLDDQDDE
ncbi:hypothetical protein DFA_00007 [Cavenderia fasciculata]|uniref:RWD domain-containing protein n=1 Tax=Cavenderia fasciculata TaxID=261658 RepID=F4PXC0_CACFS|nr:uncharacterized protein DFA_00007 [Cavenderia fasciculata]EGG19430.1 hypothetical protein DFA_00007 [Cavenderia fasciculata]|eukprot:XP_004357724.1 hypothetical protein DFA_00007 [Cavenderia fasciculata]